MNRVLASALLVPFAICAAFAAAEAPDPRVAVLSCAGSESPELESLRAASAAREGAIDPRLKLADALLARQCYAEAVRVLEAGEALHPNSNGIQSRLRTARTMLSEQHYFDARDRAAQSAKAERNRLRCQKLGDTAACDEALSAEPNDAALVMAKADALVQANRPAEALPLYRHAAELDAQADIDAKLAAAEAQRQTQLAQCQNESADVALRACQLALLPGSSDEFSIYKRKGILLQQMDEPLRALDSFIAAGLLKSNDETVSRAIVSLMDSTGRNDAVAFAARGRALLTLHRGADAVEALVRARTLLPDMADLEAPLAAAEELAKNEARQAKVAMAQREAERTARTPAAESSVSAAPVDDGPENPEQIRVASRAASEEKRTYSNDSPATRSH